MASHALNFEFRSLVRSEHEAEECFTGWRQFNDDLHLVHTLEGGGMLRVGGRRYPATPTTVLAVPAHTSCAWEKRAGVPWRMLNFHCRLGGNAGGAVPPYAPLPILLRPPGLADIHTRLRQAAQWQAAHAPAAAVRAAAVVLAVLGEYLRLFGQPVLVRRTDGLMVRLRDEIDRRIAEPFAAPALAASVGLSVSQVNRRFRAAFGSAPKAYRQARRLAAAEAMLRDRADHLDQLAAELGFIDVFHFSRWFKARIGVAPGTYRRQVRRLGA